MYAFVSAAQVSNCRMDAEHCCASPDSRHPHALSAAESEGKGICDAEERLHMRTHLNSPMMASRSFWGMSPCMALTVKLFCRIFSVSQSTFRLVLQKMTACAGTSAAEHLVHWAAGARRRSERGQ